MAELFRRCRWAGVIAAALGTGILPSVALGQSCVGGFELGAGYPGLGGLGLLTNLSPRSNAMTVWDPDGNGPQPEMLVVGGAFTSVDGVAANGVAAWDGRQWRALGSGLQNQSHATGAGVTCLAVHDGVLYAGGRFGVTASDSTNVARVARWDGTAWIQVGPNFTGTVNALTSFGGSLYVGGQFTLAAGGNLAKLVGSSWVGFGPAVFGSVEYSSSRVDSLAVQGDSLLIGGTFSQYIVRQNAAGARTPVGPPLAINYSGSVSSIYTSNQDIYIAGDFRTTSAQPGVMHWDGTAWTTMRAPVTTGVRQLVGFNGSIYLSSGLISTSDLLDRWSGTAWTPVLPQQTFVSVDGQVNVAALGVFGDRLILGGSFGGVTDVSMGSVIPRSILSLAWVTSDDKIGPISRGLGSRVASFSMYQGKVVAGGRFTSIGRWIGGAQVPGTPGRLAEIDADGFWAPFSGGVPDDNIWATAVFGGQLVIGGEMFSVGGVTGAVAAAWDGGAWHDMSAGAQGIPVRLVAAGSQLWGEFAPSGTSFSPRALGWWDGARWQMLGDGSGYSGLLAAPSGVYSTEEATRRVVRLSSGSVVLIPLPPTETSARTIGTFEGDVVCASDARMYRWDGQLWTPAGLTPSQGLPQTANLGVSVELGGVMYVGDNTPALSPNDGEEIVGWDGRAWHLAGAMSLNPNYSTGVIFGSSARPPSLMVLGADQMLVGGAFQGVRWKGGQQSNSLDPAANAAALSVEGSSITTLAPPLETVRDRGQSVNFEWNVTPALSGARYTWYGPYGLLMNGANANVGYVSGANTNVLRIQELVPGATGYYRCQAIDACQNLQLGGVLLTVNFACDADVNGDGLVDAGDVDYLINVVAGGENPENIDADFNHDGNSDQTDIDALINSIAGGGCP